MNEILCLGINIKTIFRGKPQSKTFRRPVHYLPVGRSQNHIPELQAKLVYKKTVSPVITAEHY